MISSLKIENFRGFHNHELPLKDLTIIIGQNNAGKSTIVEALRLISLVVNRYKNLAFHEAPDWLNIPMIDYGVSPSLRNMEINFETMFYGYAEPPSIITAYFINGCSITLYLSSLEKIHAVIRNKKGKIIKSKAEALKLNLPEVSIMPQVAPVQKEEKILSPDYVRSSISSLLAPLHFRNQINLYYDLFEEFKNIVEYTWPKVKIIEFVGMGKQITKPLFLHVRNEDFVAEISVMGHGLQMWLQTMWFLTRSKNASTIILDEPDVYMHADLQRKLIRYIRHRYPQIIIATHSVEIISEVTPDNILIVDRRKEKSDFANSLPAVQKLINNVGSVHNIHLAKLWYSNRLIIVEGKDLKILKQFQDTLFKETENSFESIPHMSIGGWGGWNYVIGSKLLIKNSLGEKITIYCIFDSDYHTKHAIKIRNQEAKDKKIELHIWSKKEIENYLLVPATLHRLISRSVPKRTYLPSIKEINDKIIEIANSMEDEVLDAISTEELANKHALGSGGANRIARKRIEKHKSKQNGMPNLVSGKVVISRLSGWSKEEFGVSFNAIGIAKEMSEYEIDEEVKNVIRAINDGDEFI